MRQVKRSQTQQLKRHIKLFMALWSLVAGVSLAWNLFFLQDHFEVTLHTEAQAFHTMEMQYRNWVIHSGGVYVPITDKTPPSPWLSEVPERDVTTPSGKKLTLLNSSYVVRLVHQAMTGSNTPLRGSIASLNPINPVNAADAWERLALEAFARGEQEQSTIEVMDDGKTYFRYMKPMITEEACLKCHARYGDTLGGIRGGVSVAVPIDGYLMRERHERNALIAGHGLIWGMGMFGLLLGGRRQQRAIQAAEQSEAQVTLLTNSIAHAIYGVNLQGCCTFINAAGLKAFGYDQASDVLGKNMHELVHHTRADGSSNPYERCPSFFSIRDGQSFYRDNEIFWRKDGSSLPVAYWSYPVMQEGSVRGAVVTFLDMTEQLRVKGELKHSQVLLNSIVENIPVMVFLRRAEDLSFELINRAGEQLLGYSRNELLGKTVYDFFPKEQADSWAQKDRETLESHLPMEISEEPIKVADGSEKWLRTFKIGLYDEAGTATHLLGISVDISKQKQMQDELRQSEAKLAEAQRMAHMGHWQFDLKTHELTWSDEVYRIFEVDPEHFDVTYQRYLDSIHPDDRELVAKAFTDSLQHRVPFQTEFRIQMKDGRTKYALEKCETTYDGSGHPLRSLGTIQDNSASKMIENVLRDQQKVLEHALEGTIHTVSLAAELRDPYTAGHQRRVAELAVAIAKEMGLPEEKVHGIHLAASIHDLGKIHVPAEILSKPGQLTDIEFMLIKTHPQTGNDILKDIYFPWPIAEIIRQHHEKLDGTGYPHGLKGDEILLESRILTVADVVEAMSSHRPYRPTLGIDVALKEIERGRGTAYDPVVVDACLKLFHEGRLPYQG